MVVVLTQVAGYAGVAHQRVVYGGASLNVTGAGDAKQHGALRTVVSAPVGAANFGRVAIYIVRKDVTDLVAVGAQVTFAAIIGLAFDFEHVYRSGCLEAPVGISVARVDVVTGTAVLASWFITRSLHFVGALPSGDHGAVTHFRAQIFMQAVQEHRHLGACYEFLRTVGAVLMALDDPFFVH